MLYSLYVTLVISAVFWRSSPVTKGSETLNLKHKFVERMNWSGCNMSYLYYGDDVINQKILIQFLKNHKVI